ncbi:hypothetical protein ACFLQU_06280, partial [Verrucomicrobiota bacterium]
VCKRLWGAEPNTKVNSCKLDKNGKLWTVVVWSSHPLAGWGCEVIITKTGHLKETKYLMGS